MATMMQQMLKSQEELQLMVAAQAAQYEQQAAQYEKQERNNQHRINCQLHHRARYVCARIGGCVLSRGGEGGGRESA